MRLRRAIRAGLRQFGNVNADEMAAACAVACGADALVFLTDVPGVKDANGAVLRWLSIDQIAEMAKSAVPTTAMARRGSRRPGVDHT